MTSSRARPSWASWVCGASSPSARVLTRGAARPAAARCRSSSCPGRWQSAWPAPCPDLRLPLQARGQLARLLSSSCSRLGGWYAVAVGAGGLSNSVEAADGLGVAGRLLRQVALLRLTPRPTLARTAPARQPSRAALRRIQRWVRWRQSLGAHADQPLVEPALQVSQGATLAWHSPGSLRMAWRPRFQVAPGASGDRPAARAVHRGSASAPVALRVMRGAWVCSTACSRPCGCCFAEPKGRWPLASSGSSRPVNTHPPRCRWRRRRICSGAA